MTQLELARGRGEGVWKERVTSVLVAGSLLGCVPEPARPTAGEVPEVSISPLAGARALPVVRLSIRAPAETALEPQDVGLFAGPLSAYDLGRIARRDLAKTLLERRVPVVRFRDEASGDIVVAPEVALEPGATYTLASPSWGNLAEFEVANDAALPLLERVWPPRSEAGAGFALFCGPYSPAPPLAFELAPSGLPAEVTAVPTFTPEQSCLAVRFQADGLVGTEVVFPAELAGFAFDPQPLTIQLHDAPVARACGEGESALGPGCVRVEDDRAIVSGPDEPILWLVEGDGAPGIFPARARSELVLRGLLPATRQRLFGLAVSASGVEHPFDLGIETAPARPRLVLNEVLANPLGAEPGGEWIELVNDGASEAELSELELEDSAGTVRLPAGRVAPGEHVLIARADFSASLSDVAPAPNTRVYVLPELAKNGLSNTGEPLFLWATSGELVSSFPALPARRAGASIARARPDALDSDPSAFAEHAPPGASPGAPNQLAPAER